MILVLIACTAFALGSTYWYFFIGSARADAEIQMRYLLGIMVFGWFTLISNMLDAYVRKVCWHDDEVTVGTLRGKKRVRRDTITAIDRDWLSYIVLVTRDGNRLRFSPFMSGIESLFEYLSTEDDPKP